MAMVVKNNMSAIGTLNTLNKNSAALAKSLQKVSSGMKINSAADDASGFAISERMRVQIRSLDQANQNTQNGSSMMKTAEGAVSSTVEILKTLKEKVINAANDSNTDQDRQTIQKEMDQSIDQIDDNANVTFNGKYLVDGSKNTIGTATKTTLTNQSLSTDTHGASTLTSLKSRSGDDLEITTTDKVTVSYVNGGNTYTTTFSVTANSKLEDIFTAANAAANVNPTLTAAQSALSAAATDVSTAAASVGAAVVSKAADELAALKTGGTINAAAETSGNKATSDAIDTWVTTAAASATATATAAMTASSKLAMSEVDTSTVAAAMKSDVEGAISDAIDAVPLTAYTDAVSAYNTAVGAYSDALESAGAQKGVELLTECDGTSHIGTAASGDEVKTADGKPAITITAKNEGVHEQISGFTISITDSEGNVKKSANAALDAFNETIRAQNKSEDNALTLHVGAKANQSIKVGLTDMRSEALGLKGSDGTKLNISTQDKANAAINVLDNAIQKALDQQTTIGSVESRLEYTSSNLTTASENVQASESAIRDADMAKEMTNYTKNNVLLQAAQSMLAQANQNSSAVLSLLQ